MLDRYFSGIFQSVTYYGFHGQELRSKVDTCRQLKADVLIDDNVYHATQAAKVGLNVLLFGDYPWDQADLLPDNVTRTRGWSEIEGALQEKH